MILAQGHFKKPTEPRLRDEIIAPVAQTGRGREHTARASGDGYNRLPEPHTHLCSQQAALSKRGGIARKRAVPALDLAPSIFPVFWRVFFLPSTLLLFLCDTARGGNMTPAAQPGTLQSGWVFLPSSIATARLTENMYKFCSILGRCNYKVSFLITNSVCHLIVKCFKTKTGRPGQKPKGSSPLS